MSNSDPSQPQPQSPHEPINTSSDLLPSGEELLSAIRALGEAYQKVAELAVVTLFTAQPKSSPPKPPLDIYTLTKRDINNNIKSRKTSRSSLHSNGGVQGGAVNETVQQLLTAWNALRKTRFGLLSDRTTTDAKPWIAKRLQEHSAEMLSRCVERYFSEQRSGDYLCAVRNFFGSKAYFEAYLAEDWTPPQPKSRWGEKAIDLSVGGDYWGKQP